LEDVSVYGFLTNTHVKIVVMIEGGDGSGGIRDSDVKAVSPPFWNMFNDLVIRRIHDAYVGVVFNPFYVPEDKEGIISAKFDRDIERIGREWKTII
jgi:hypothetical protein